MAYFADLTPHSYSPTRGLNVLNVGWCTIMSLITLTYRRMNSSTLLLRASPLVRILAGLR